MNISGVLVQARPERAADVGRDLAAIPGVEVHETAADGRMVVTIEDTDATASGDTLVKINLLDGVLAASLVYHHFEPDADATPPAPPSPLQTHPEA